MLMMTRPDRPNIFDVFTECMNIEIIFTFLLK